MTLISTAATALAFGGWVVPPAQASKPIPPSIKMVGRTCDRPIQVVAARTTSPLGVHPFDEQWIDLALRQGASDGDGAHEFTFTWSLSPSVELCPGGWTRLGYGDQVRIADRTGSRTGTVSERGPVKAKVNARFKQDIRMRSGLGRTRVTRLVRGWVKRECGLPPGGASEVLENLIERAGGSNCKAPQRVRPTATQLLRHLVARFNARRSTDDTSYGREYYRVLAQLTTYRR